MQLLLEAVEDLVVATRARKIFTKNAFSTSPCDLLPLSWIQDKTECIAPGTRVSASQRISFVLATLLFLIVGCASSHADRIIGEDIISNSEEGESSVGTDQRFRLHESSPILQSLAVEDRDEEISLDANPFLNASFFHVYLDSNGSKAFKKVDLPNHESAHDRGTNSHLRTHAVCSTQRPLDALFPGGSDICHVVINTGKDSYGNPMYAFCTGAFVYNYGGEFEYTVATAAHCVTDEQKAWQIQPLNDAPSFICCDSLGSSEGSDDDFCPERNRFRIRAVTVPKSYIEGGEIVRIDDAAMLGVTPYETTLKERNPYAWEFLPNLDSICTTSLTFRYYGYPGFSDYEDGCTEGIIIPGYLHYSRIEGLLNCQQATSGEFAMGYLGSSCPGMSGGPLIARIDGTNAVVGILSGGSNSCNLAGSAVFFARSSNARNIPGFQPETMIQHLRYGMRLAIS